MLGNAIGSKIIELEETDSTNSYASRLLYDQLPLEGTVIMAGYQRSGRGQRGSGWESNKMENLLISYILYPSFLPVGEHFLLNQAISLSVYDFVRAATSAPVTIKWPNDILVGNKKIAGLLIENSIRSNKFSSTICGIGVNINQTRFKVYSPVATSLQLIENKVFSVSKSLLELNIHVEKWYSVLRSGNYKRISENYSAALHGLSVLLEFESNGENFTGVIKGVNSTGQLILSKSNGVDVCFNNKELKFKF